MLVRDTPGCPSLRLTGWCLSGCLAGSPLGNAEEKVLISLRTVSLQDMKRCVTWAFPTWALTATPSSSEIHICSSLCGRGMRGAENKWKSNLAHSFLGPQEGILPMWFSHFQVFGWWVRLSRNAPSPDNNTFRCRIRSIWIKTRRWMMNTSAYRGRHGNFLHLNEKALSLPVYVN